MRLRTVRALAVASHQPEASTRAEGRLPGTAENWQFRPLAVLGERLLPGNRAGGIPARVANQGVECDGRAGPK